VLLQGATAEQRVRFRGPLVDVARVEDLAHQVDSLVKFAACSRDLQLALARRSRLEPEVDLVVETIALRRQPFLLGPESC